MTAASLAKAGPGFGDFVGLAERLVRGLRFFRALTIFLEGIRVIFLT